MQSWRQVRSEFRGYLSRRTGAALVGALGAAWLLQLLRAPLPWLIGPLLSVAVANGMHAGIRMPSSARTLGQWLVGSALGLYFTFAVVTQIFSLTGWIALAVGLSILCSIVCSRGLSRFGGVDRITAFFACSVGGAAEMANIAERFGARTDQVAAAHAVRVLMVVTLVPFAFTGVQGADAYTLPSVALRPGPLACMLLASFVASYCLWRIRIPNAWLFGGLIVSALLTATDNAPSSMPAWIVDAGQLLIGCSLGARFAPEFFRDSPRFLLGVIVSCLLLLACCALVGTLVGALSVIPLPTAILATIPGGLAEMGMIAAALQLGAPIVTAFHTVRLIVVVVSAGPVCRWLIAAKQHP